MGRRVRGSLVPHFFDRRRRVGGGVVAGGVQDVAVGDEAVLGQGNSGRLVDDELDFGAGVVFQLAGAIVPINGFLRAIGETQAEQFDAGFVIGRPDEEFLAQAAGAADGGVNAVGQIGGADNEDAVFPGLVQLDEELVDFAGVVVADVVGRLRPGRLRGRRR